LAITLLLKKSPIKKANTILGIIFLLMVVTGFNNLMAQHINIQPNSILLFYYLPWDHICLLSFGPGIYFYLREILGQPNKIATFVFWKHFMPVIPGFVFIAYLMVLPTEQRILLIKQNMEQNIWQIKLLNALFYMQMTSYLAYCYYLIRKQLKVSETVVLNNTKINIKWLKNYFLLDLGIMIFSAPLAFIVQNDYTNAIISLFAMNVQFIYIYYHSYKQTGVFLEEKIEQTKPPEHSLKIDDKIADSYLEKLLQTMETDKLYLDENCSIHSVAQAANIPYHHLSRILNTNLNKNFFTFINEYRIVEAKKMLSDSLYIQFTIEAIAFECGFGSKTTFNNAFKKCTGLTPQQFRKSIQDAPCPSSN